MAAVMTGVTAHLIFDIVEVVGEIAFHLEVLPVQLFHHMHHLSCGILFRLGVRGEIHSMARSGGSMAIDAFISKGLAISIHDMDEGHMINILGKNLQVLGGLAVGRSARLLSECETGHQENAGDQDPGNPFFLGEMLHKIEIWLERWVTKMKLGNYQLFQKIFSTNGKKE